MRRLAWAAFLLFNVAVLAAATSAFRCESNDAEDYVGVVCFFGGALLALWWFALSIDNDYRRLGGK